MSSPQPKKKIIMIDQSKASHFLLLLVGMLLSLSAESHDDTKKLGKIILLLVICTS
jgi:hypothetical protein